MELRNEDFDYILSSEIIVMGNYKNEDYHKRVMKWKDEIELAWKKEQEERSKKLFNGVILNLATIEQQQIDNRLTLQCHAVEYKHYLAQRKGIDLGITPIAVSGIVFYQENGFQTFYIGKRSESVTQYPGYYEFMPSGSIDAENLAPKQPVDYSKQLFFELKEELGIPVENIINYRAFCVIFDETDRVYDIGIEIEVSNTNFKTDIAEYSAVQRLPLSSVVEYVKSNDMVNTSRKLFEAWSSFR